MTDDEKRVLLKEWNEATEAFFACQPQDEGAAKERMLEVNRRAREVFGAVIPKSI